MVKFSDLETNDQASVALSIYAFWQSQDNKFLKAISLDTVCREVFNVNPNVENKENKLGLWSIDLSTEDSLAYWDEIRINCLETVKPKGYDSRNAHRAKTELNSPSKN